MSARVHDNYMIIITIHKTLLTHELATIVW
jgi:hypothetical protein